MYFSDNKNLINTGNELKNRADTNWVLDFLSMIIIVMIHNT